MGKAVIISMDDLLYFQKYYLNIKVLIERTKISNFLWIIINSDGTCTEEKLGNPKEINQSTIINIVEEKLKTYKGHSFINVLCPWGWYTRFPCFSDADNRSNEKNNRCRLKSSTAVRVRRYADVRKSGFGESIVGHNIL